MEFYFFLKAPALDAEITVSNFPPAAPAGYTGKRNFVCSAVPEGGQWRLDTLCPIDAGRSLTVRASDVQVPVEKISSTLLFLSSTAQSGAHAELPRSSEFSSIPNWRANLRVRGPHTSASYQGEYPGSMLDNRNGTLVSISPMQQAGVCNGVFLANFTRTPRDEQCRVVFRDLASRRLLGEKLVATNRVNYLDLSDLDAGPAPALIVAASNEIFGIPIYFSHDAEFRRLSLEHTHPPVELTVFGEASDRYALAGQMKRNWLAWAYET